MASELAVEPGALWQAATRPDGINRELGPILTMTFPKGVSDVTAGWRAGRRQFRCWLLLGGMLPVEFDDLTFVSVRPGYGFRERSRLLSQRTWEHDRTIVRTERGSTITDVIRFEPRIALLTPLYERVFRLLFRWRHRNLRRIYGRAA